MIVYFLLPLLESLPEEKSLFAMDIILKTYVSTKYLIHLTTIVVVVPAVLALVVIVVVAVVVSNSTHSYDLNSLNVLLHVRFCSRHLTLTIFNPFCKSKTYVLLFYPFYR